MLLLATNIHAQFEPKTNISTASDTTTSLWLIFTITQTGTNAPILTYIRNDIQGNITTARQSAGNYTITLPQNFADEKVHIYNNDMNLMNYDGSNGWTHMTISYTTGVFTLNSKCGGVNRDNVWNGTYSQNFVYWIPVEIQK